MVRIARMRNGDIDRLLPFLRTAVTVAVKLRHRTGVVQGGGPVALRRNVVSGMISSLSFAVRTADAIRVASTWIGCSVLSPITSGLASLDCSRPGRPKP